MSYTFIYVESQIAKHLTFLAVQKYVVKWESIEF